MKTFLNLLRKFDKIEIPIIQRDYAHGRNDERSSSVRNLLIEALTNAAIDKQTEKLCLDFIYGRVVDAENGKIFIPFDGQQRLTTLFLFYRYVAEKSGDLENYKSDFAKFSYNTRSSAKNFCIALCNEHILNSEHRLVEIKDRLWFLPSWQYDPTIQGMMTVLKAIDEKISKRKDHISLSDLEANIYFEALPMDELGLDDDSYVTMNARFLSLTPWERFKSSFQKWAKYKEIYNFTGYEKCKFKKFDDAWLDLFYRDDDKNYDENMMNMVHFHLFLFDDKPEDEKEYKYPDGEFVPFNPIYRDILDKNERVLVSLFRLWDYLSTPKKKESLFAIWDRNEIKKIEEDGKKIEHIIKLNNSYASRLAYYSIVLYFEKKDDNKYDDDTDSKLSEWMRIVWNLLEHAIVDSTNYETGKKTLKDLIEEYWSGNFGNTEGENDKNDDSTTYEIWGDLIEDERIKYKFLKCKDVKDEDKKRLYILESDSWIHGRLKTYREPFNSINSEVLAKLEERAKWLKDEVKANCKEPDFRFKLIKIMLEGEEKKLKGENNVLRNHIEFKDDPESTNWVREFKKGIWDHIWQIYENSDEYKKDIYTNIESNIESWPSGRLELLKAVLSERQGAYVKLAYYGNIPCVRTNEKSNVATSYLLDFEHYVIHKEKDKLLPNRCRAVKFVRNENNFQLKLKFTDSNEEEFTPYNVKPEYIDAWKPLIKEDKFKEDDENRPVL